MKAYFRHSALLALAVGLAGCNVSRETPPEAPTKKRDLPKPPVPTSAAHPSIGTLAPDIEGKDLDGRSLKLSNFRGKVVMLDFWASWCGPCRQMIPEGRAIAKRLEGKPFALLGVNVDESRMKAQKVVASDGITWPSWWDPAPDSKISKRWDVNGYPTVYIIDKKGIIRSRTEGLPDDPAPLNWFIDKLLAES